MSSLLEVAIDPWNEILQIFKCVPFWLHNCCGECEGWIRKQVNYTNFGDGSQKVHSLEVGLQSLSYLIFW